MRTTGVNFARGSCCRALKWMAPMRMALFGVVFAVGAGSASAQMTISGTDDNTKVLEGDRAAFNVSIKWRQAVSAPARTVVVSGTAAVSFRDPAAMAAGALPIAAPQTNTCCAGNGNRDGTLGNLITEAEDADFTAALAGLTLRIPQNTSTATTTQGTASGTIYMETATDADAEDEAVRVTFTVAADSATGQDNSVITVPTDATRELIIDDRQEQKFRWRNVPSDLKEGGSATWQIDADPPGTNLEWVTSLFTNEAGYSFSATTVGTGNPPSRDVTLTAPTSDGNRTDDTVTVRAVAAGTRTDLPGLGPLEIEVEDLHALPEASKITAEAYADNGRGTRTSNKVTSVTEGGDPVHVRVTIDRGDDGYPTGEALAVRPAAASPNQSADIRLENPPDIASGSGKKTADFKLWARADNDVGDETLTLDLVTTGKTAANGTGQVVGTFSINIVDATTAQVEPKAEAVVEAAVMAAMGSAPLNPGGDFMVDAGELFTSDSDTYDVTYSASVDGTAVSASVSGDMVTVTAREAGDATVTVSANAEARASSAVSTSQTVANRASVSFDVTVVLADLVVTLSGPPDTNITEGGQPYIVTATANRAVTADTTIRLEPAAGSDASPNDYSVGTITIGNGETTGTTEVRATADTNPETSETLVLQGYLGNMKLEPMLTLTIWDAAVPALPVIAQLLLAAFLAIGGYRRYLRRR